MKKIILVTIIACFSLSGVLYAKPNPDNVRIDAGFLAYKPATVDWAAGANLAFGYAFRDIDFLLGGRYMQYDLGTLNPKDMIHAYGRADVKFHLPNNPITLFAGLGFGYGYATMTYLKPVILEPGTRALKGPIVEFSGGAMFPLSQTISAVARAQAFYANYPIDENASFDVSGIGIEIGVRFSAGSTRELAY